MTLVSLNCSGESIEKVVALYHTSYIVNHIFYNSFDRIILFCSNNLPKKDKSRYGVNGTLSCLYYNWLDLLSQKEKKNVLDGVRAIQILADSGNISERASKETLKNKERIERLLANVPSNIICPSFYRDIVDSFYSLYPNTKIIMLPTKQMLSSYISENCDYDRKSKIYSLQANGDIGLFVLNKWDRQKQHNMVERICRSVCLSPNIYTYIVMIKQYMLKFSDEYMIGYRPMIRFKRMSYDCAIDRLDSKRLLIEPPNKIFTQILNQYSMALSVEERSNISIIEAFNKFLSQI